MRQLFLLLILLVSFSSCKKAELVPDFEDYCGTWTMKSPQETLIITQKSVIHQSLLVNENLKIQSMYYSKNDTTKLFIDAKIKHVYFNGGRTLSLKLNADKSELTYFNQIFTKQ